MELRQYVNLAIKWLWLIILGTVLAAGTAYFISARTAPVYRATTTLYISPASTPLLTDYTSILTSNLLAKTYGELLKKRPVMEEAIAQLHLKLAPDQLAGMISVTPVANTQLLTIAVESTDPALAKAIANTVPDVFIKQQDTFQTSRFTSSKQNLLDQLTSIQSDIDNTTKSLDAARTSTAVTIDAKQNEITRLETTLSGYRNSYASILKSYEDLRVSEAKSADSIIVAEPAIQPSRPVRPNKTSNTLLAAIVGAMLAVGTAFLIEYLDDTVKDPADVQRALETSTLGLISRIVPVDKPSDAVVTASHPKSSIAEAYRMLRTNVQFAMLDNPSTSVVITSAGPQEGKSTTLANLGVAIAQGGKRTLLVDTDLRRPSLHKVFDLPNKHGVTNMLLSESPDVAAAVQATSVPNLDILTCGPQPPNPAELLASKRMDNLIKILKEHYEAVLWDSPPVLAVADASIMAGKIGEAILVVDSGRTRTQAIQQAKQILDSSGVKLLGVALNRISARRSGYGYYYYYYYSSDGDKTKRRHSHRKWWQVLPMFRSSTSSNHSGNGKHAEAETEAEGTQAVEETRKS